MADLNSAAQAWDDFLAGFEWSVYDENTVPEDAAMPRITYNWAESEIGTPVLLTASLWDRSRSWANVSRKADEMFEAIGYGGVTIPVQGGYMWVLRGAPFSQRMADPDDSIRRIVINIQAEFLRA